MILAREEISTSDRTELNRKIASAPEWAPDDLPIQILQTHISTVFIGQKHVLKTKKPVDFGFLDYTTLEKRLSACKAELELNRRLCRDVYLSVQPICDIDGIVHLSASGRILDYGVLMKRLPPNRMLDHMVADGSVTESVIERICEKLCAFHQAARRTPEIDRFGSIHTISQNWIENFDQTRPFAGRTIDKQALDQIERWVCRNIEQKSALFEDRIASGCIRDGHGDVRCESICVTADDSANDIAIFDCIEFNDRFRYADVASEVAFLSMDLDIRGRPDLGYYFAECYKKRSSDAHLFDLMPFYKCYRAFVRGKVLSFRLDQTGLSDAEKHSATARARVYFDYAHRYSTPLSRPALIAVGGLSGTGKSTLARAIASELNLKVISADSVRKSIFGTQIATEQYQQGAYGAEANARTYRTMLDLASDSLVQGRPLVLDATFRRRSDRDAAHRLAHSLGADFRLIVCRLDPDVIKTRISRRAALKEGLSDATWPIYLKQSQEFEPGEDLGNGLTLVIDTERPLSHCSRVACDWLRSSISGNHDNP